MDELHGIEHLGLRISISFGLLRPYSFALVVRGLGMFPIGEEPYSPLNTSADSHQSTFKDSRGVWMHS